MRQSLFTSPNTLVFATFVLGVRVFCGAFGVPGSDKEKGRVDFLTLVAGLFLGRVLVRQKGRGGRGNLYLILLRGFLGR